MDGKIKLELTRDEAMLLLQSIVELNRHDALDTLLSEAEKYVFTYIACMLENSLPAYVRNSQDALNAAESTIQANLVSYSAIKCHERLLSNPETPEG